MIRYLVVEVRVGVKDETPSITDWAAYKFVRDQIGRTNTHITGGDAEVGQVLELTNVGIRPRLIIQPGEHL
jgi:hypothetical protein